MTELDTQIHDLKQHIKKLKEELLTKEKLLYDLLLIKNQKPTFNNVLTTDEVVRYSRQMIMPDVTLNGQIALKNSKVLIVGVGGLGCPSSLYLAAAGVGEITLIDYDTVELSNLHRQILHFEADLNMPKVESAYQKLKRLNSNVKIIPLKEHANSEALKKILSNNKYDVIVDGSDNVATRYLLNDICVLNNIPLVSGSALKMDGQLTVYHYRGGPCYRCLFPIPPPAETVTNCGDGGVLGAVPGVIGVLQALETIKIITKSTEVLSGRLLLFDGTSSTFRNIRLRNRSDNCNICGDNPTLTDLIDYEQFCGASAHDKVININILKASEEVEVEDFSKLLDNQLVLDVRPELEFKMCNIPNTLNFPLDKMQKNEGVQELKELFERKLKDKNFYDNSFFSVYVICRRGNDSQKAITYLKEKFSNYPIKFYNVKRGLHAFSKLVDPNFPIY